VALARALAPRPEVILLDEPFSNLDASLRQRVRREVKQILTEAKATALFVTHDQEEALSLSDRVAVMQAGRVRQVSAPPDLYRSPADPWVADFLGDADFVNGLAANGKAATPVGEFATELSGSVTVMLRPENVRISPDPAGPGQVSGVEYFGHDQLITAVLDLGVIIRTRSGPGAHFQVGDRVRIEVAEATVFPA
jgi:iron(III) transport system ATP-binding protein